MIKKNKSIDWYFNSISCIFETQEEIDNIKYKTTGKRLVKILLSEIEEFRNNKSGKIGDFGELLSVYNMNLELRSIKITKDYNDYRKHIYNFEFRNMNNLEEIYYIDLKFLDYLYFQDIKDSDFK